MHNKFNQVLLLLLLSLSPLAFWTLTSNSFVPAKLFLLLTLALLMVVSYSVKMIASKTVSLPRHPLTLPLIIFILSLCLSLFANPEGRVEAFSGKATVLLILSLISLLTLSLKPTARFLRHLVSVLIGLSSLLALYSLLQLTLIPSLSFIPSFMRSKVFTPTGDYLTTLTIIVAGLSAAITRFKNGATKSKPFYLSAILLATVATVAIISLMFPGSPLSLALMPYQAVWSITLDSFKSLRTLFFGVGLANFPLLFTAVKPLSLNNTALWDLVPQTGTSEFLTLLATGGILSGLSFVWISLQGLKSSQRSELYLPLLIFIFAIVLLPYNIALYTCLFICLSCANTEDPKTIPLAAQFIYPLGFIVVILSLLGYGYRLRPQIADYYTAQAQIALKNSDGKQVYDLEQRAIAMSPQTTLYHLSFAQINLSLAVSLSQKTTLSDADKSTLSTLVQQAINESKAAISLEPNNSAAWLTLGKVYRSLIGVATGSDNFAVDNYAKAVALDPSNPALRLDFGGLFSQLKNYDRAKTEFQTAIQLRPTYSNAYYNLAKLEETMGDYSNAYTAMQKTISLLGPSNNTDLNLATTDLETLKTKLPKATPAPSDATTPVLSTPSPLPSPQPGSKIDL